MGMVYVFVRVPVADDGQIGNILVIGDGVVGIKGTHDDSPIRSCQRAQGSECCG